MQPAPTYTQTPYYQPPVQQQTYTATDTTPMEDYGDVGAQGGNYAEAPEDLSGQYYEEDGQYWPPPPSSS